MRALLACICACCSLTGCANRQHITWEDVGVTTASKNADAGHAAQANSAPPRDPDAALPAAPAAETLAPRPMPGPAPTPSAPTQVEPRPGAPNEAVDLTPRGAASLPGVAARVEDGGLVDVEAMTLVCIADARALTDTALVFRRLEEEAEKVNAKLGGVRLIRFARDPARSLSDPPPRACRTLVGESALKAPLARDQERKSTWLVTASTGSIVDDAARAAARASAGAYEVTLPPRAVVDEAGAITAVAIPVERKAGGG